jgi:hypothetical protein
MTRNMAENGPSNAGSSAGPNSNPEFDRLARLNAQLLPPGQAVLEADRHSYPLPPQRVHGGSGISAPTGGRGGGYLHESRPTKAD